MLFRVKISISNSHSYTDWYVETPVYLHSTMQSVRWANPTAALSVERQQGPPTTAPPTPEWTLMNDPNPRLGNDLDLNGHSLLGQLEETTLVIDGGLI